VNLVNQYLFPTRLALLIMKNHLLNFIKSSIQLNYYLFFLAIALELEEIDKIF